MSTFLDLQAVVEIHSYLIERYGGSPGIRDEGLLLSAIEQASLSFAGEMLHPDLASKAAAYLYHLCQNHPFIDGNKRVALAAALVFIELNDTRCAASTQELEDLTMAVASSSTSKSEVADFFRCHGVA